MEEDPSVNEGDPAGPSPSPSPTPNTSLVATGIGDLATRATFLALFIIIGVVGNSVLLATIAQSSRLKGTVLNLLIISVSVVNLVDCLGNMPLILGSAIREHWDYGTIVCNFNAFLMQTVTIGMILGLMLMTVDRMLAAKYPDSSSSQLSKIKANVLIIYTWIHSVAFSFPLILGSTIPVAAFPARYSCSIKAGAPLLYVALTSILGILIPFLLIIAFFIYIIKVAVQEKVRQKRNSAEKSAPEQGVTPESRIWLELNASKFVGVLVVLWAIFQGPYLLLTYIEQYRTTSEIESAALLKFSYPWEMELAFTWMKLSYPIFLPLITFCWKKEVWQRFKNFILCRKSNLIVDASPNSSPGHRANGEAQAIKKSDTTTSLAVPVIFATEEGLHYQTFGKRSEVTEEDSDVEYPEYDYSAVNGSQILTARKCDIYGSQDFIQIRDDEDTSDYDSQGDLDPYSNSNAMSVKSGGSDKGKGHHGERSRQNSESKENSVIRDPDIVQDIPDVAKVDPAYPGGKGSKSSRDADKKKQKAPKVEGGEEEMKAQEMKSNRKSARQDPERGSHDSGRGSLEDRSQKKKRRKAQRAEDYNGVEQVEEPRELPSYPVEAQNPEAKMSPPSAHMPEEQEANDKRPRKKKKRKSPLKSLAKEPGIELSEHPAQEVGSGECVQEGLGKDIARPIPPPRLKPLEITNSLPGNIDNAAKLPDVRKPKKEQQQPKTTTIIRQVSEFNTDTHKDDHVKHTSKLSGSVPAVNQCTDSSMGDVRPRTASSGAKPGMKKEKHQRRSTADSQTALLSSSNTSVDFDDMHIMAAKTVSETVHITPKTPDCDLDRLEYGGHRSGRRGRRPDDERI